MESDMEKQGGRKRQQKEGNGSDACYEDVDAEEERCPKKARKELEENISAEPGDVISQLPDLAQDSIFSFLGVRDKVQVAQVCSFWQNAVYRPCQWKEVKVRVGLCKFHQKTLASLKERKIRHLKVGYNSHAESNVLDMLHDCLVSLDLSETCLSLGELHQIFLKSLISLRKLCVHVKSDRPLAFQSVQEVFQHLSYLEDLDLHVGKCENDALQAVGRCIRSLKRFSLRGSWRISCKLQFLGHLSSLQSLNLAGVTLQGIDCLKLSCNSLKNVSLKHCHFDTDRWPEVLCQLSSLEELKVYACRPVVEDGLRQLALGQRNMKALMYDLYFYPPFVLDLLTLAEMPNLDTLSVSYCYLPNDADLGALSCGLKNVKSLAMTGLSNFSVALMKGIAGLSSLQELSFRRMQGVDGTALEILSSGSCQLRRLELMNCDGSGGEDMRHVAGMSSLRDLTLCDLNLGSAGMECLKQGTLRLEALSIKRCGFNFQGMKPWLEKQQSLQKLTLGSDGMTDEEKTEAQNLKKILPFLNDVVFTQFLM